MAIIGFVGTPGSGKSYDAVVKIVDNLKMGRKVFTNIEGINNLLCRQMIMQLTGMTDYGLACHLNTLSDDQVYEFWHHVEPGSLVVIDEVQNYFGSREWQTQKNQEFGRWASTHRHHGFEVLLITQDVERIDTLVRSLLEWTYVYRKVNFFGGAIKKKYLVASYGGHQVSGKRPLAQKMRTYDPQIFLCYKSYVSKDIKELGLMRHVNVLKHPVFFALPIVLGITVYMVFFKSSLGTGDLFGNEKALKRATQHNKPKAAAAAPASPGSKPAQESDPASGSTIMTHRHGNVVTFTNRGA